MDSHAFVILLCKRIYCSKCHCPESTKKFPFWRTWLEFSRHNLLFVNNIVIVSEDLGNTVFSWLFFFSLQMLCLLPLQKLLLQARPLCITSDRKTCRISVKQCSFRNEKHLNKCSPSAIRRLKYFILRNFSSDWVLNGKRTQKETCFFPNKNTYLYFLLFKNNSLAFWNGRAITLAQRL